MRSVLLIAIVLATTTTALAADTDLIARYLAGDTFLVASLDVERDKVSQLAEMITPLMTTEVDREGIKNVKQLLSDWTDRRLYVVLGLNDMPPHGGSPLVILPPLPNEDERSLVGAAIRLQDHLGLNPRHMEGHIILAADEETLDRYEARQSEDRPDLTGPLAELLEREAGVAVVVSAGADARRVLREMWPALPSPFAAVTGPLLADGLEHLSLTATLPPEWSAQFTVATADDGAADTITGVASQGLAMLRPVLQAPAAALDIDVATVLDAFAPQRADSEVSVHISHKDTAAANVLTKVAITGIQKEVERSRRSERMNDAKHIALAFHNFADHNKFFPASAAICDADGNPLLSWRVAILPFLDEGELFKEFHLDEPWDSEHNLELVERMPAIFADPARPGHQGRTRWQVPVHAESVFPPTSDKNPEQKYLNGREVYLNPGSEFRDIIDGTSNTILLVTVAPDRAVPWTKPADWEVDLDNPWADLKHEGQDGLVTAFCDGHAQYISFDLAKETLRAYLTRAGKDEIKP